jgi:protein TonB
MKRYLIPAACAAVLSTIPAASLARQDQVVVTSRPVTFVAWQKKVQHDLANRLHYPMPILGRFAGSGIVRVKFSCSESGRPDKVTLFHSSGSHALDRAALSAVHRMASMHPLPRAFGHDQKYFADIYFDDGLDSDYEAKLQAMNAAASKANSWAYDSVAAAQAPAPVLLTAAR